MWEKIGMRQNKSQDGSKTFTGNVNAPPLKFIGITGGVGAGKSEILQYIRKHYKCEIYLADEVAHLVEEPGTECFTKLVELLGKEILEECGQINKAAMADKIFVSQEILQQVNAIVHPAVKEFIMDKYKAAVEKQEIELFFVEAALLVEAGYKELVDELWYIYARRDVREARLRNSRGYSEERIANIMSKQLSEEVFRRECDFVIDNSESLADSYRQIDKKLEAFTWQE